MSLFFLHIPKTAGTSLIEMFAGAVGIENSDTFIEGRRTEWPELGLKPFTSGHLYLSEYEDLAVSESRILATVFRHPIERLVSHLRYQDRFSQDEFRPVYDSWPKHIKEATDRVNAIDFSKASSIDRYFEDMSPWEILTFDNTQVRFMIESPGPELKNYRPCIDQAAVDLAVRRLAKIDVIGTTKDLSVFAEVAMRRGGLPAARTAPHLNESGCRRHIDVADPEIRTVLEARTAMDAQLYDAVLRRLDRDAF